MDIRQGSSFLLSDKADCKSRDKNNNLKWISVKTFLSMRGGSTGKHFR